MPRVMQNLAFCIAAVAVATANGAETIQWETDLQAAFQQAQTSHRPLLLHFWTPQCVPCQRLEHTVFNQRQVGVVVRDFFVPVKIDASQHPKLAERYDVKGVPWDVIVTAEDEPLHQMYTPMDPDQYVAQLSAVAFRANSSSATRQVAHSPSGPPSNNSWSDYGRAADVSTGPYNTNSIYSRRDSYSASTPVNPITRSQPDPDEPPREVINRFARRNYDEPAVARDVAARPEAMPSEHPESSEASWNRPPQTASQGPRATESPVRRSDPNQRPAVDRYAEGRFADDRYGAGPSAGPVREAVTPPTRQAAVPTATQENATLAMDGYCPVSLLKKNSWTKGNPRYGVIHRGRTYLFAGPEEKEIFFADPDEYSPVLAGIDPVHLATTGEAMTGERAHGVVYRKRVYLFSSEANLQQFWQEPERYASPIRQAMETGDVGRLFR